MSSSDSTVKTDAKGPCLGTCIANGLAVVGAIVVMYHGFCYYTRRMAERNGAAASSERLVAHKGRSEKMHSKKSGFTESEVEQFLNTRTPDETGGAGYDPSLMSLDKGVIDSHRQFADEVYQSATGANATDVVRDDTNDVNVRWGLRRVDYTTAFSGSDARTVSSETPDQVAQHGVGTFTI